MTTHDHDTGFPIPKPLIPLFEREEIHELKHHLTVVICALEKAAKADDALFGEVNTTGTASDLRKISQHLSRAIPYAVCYLCQGNPKTQPKGQCQMCKGRGFISKYLLNSVPQELITVRAKGIKPA